MMIKKYAKLLDYNTILNTKSIEISDETNNNDNIIVYFDAALSRKIVSDKSSYARYTVIIENKEIVYFVYDKNNFCKETNYEKFNTLIQSKINTKEEGLDIYSGDCLCLYISDNQAIRVHPKSEVFITDSEFKII